MAESVCVGDVRHAEQWFTLLRTVIVDYNFHNWVTPSHVSVSEDDIVTIAGSVVDGDNCLYYAVLLPGMDVGFGTASWIEYHTLLLSRDPAEVAKRV